MNEYRLFLLVGGVVGIVLALTIAKLSNKEREIGKLIYEPSFKKYLVAGYALGLIITFIGFSIAGK
tara:strand:+ start:94 stop:291 length:198 start_codon:yes stop_codon:yes gene_type:complete